MYSTYNICSGVSIVLAGRVYRCAFLGVAPPGRARNIDRGLGLATPPPRTGKIDVARAHKVPSDLSATSRAGRVGGGVPRIGTCPAWPITFVWLPAHTSLRWNGVFFFLFFLEAALLYLYLPAPDHRVAPLKYLPALDHRDAPLKYLTALDHRDAPLKYLPALDYRVAPLISPHRTT